MKWPTPAQRAVLEAAAATADGIVPDQAMPKRTDVIDRLVDAGWLREMPRTTWFAKWRITADGRAALAPMSSPVGTR